MTQPKSYKSGYAAIIGKPNVGKSTLLNRLVSVKIAATSKSPQTTRNKITGVCHFDEGQIILLDTPGVHKATSKFNKIMVKASFKTYEDVDVIVFVMDAKQKFCEEDEYVLEDSEHSEHSEEESSGDSEHESDSEDSYLTEEDEQLTRLEDIGSQILEEVVKNEKKIDRTRSRVNLVITLNIIGWVMLYALDPVRVIHIRTTECEVF